MSPLWTKRYRLHLETEPAVFNPFADQPQDVESKPAGLWFTPTATDWVEWCADNASQWLVGKRLSPIEVDLSRVLVLSTTDQLREFTRTYRVDRFKDVPGLHGDYGAIDWCRVAEQHDGIEIVPYNYELRLDSQHFWYYGWDVASGCVWRSRSVRATMERKQLTTLTHLIHELGSPQEFESALTALAARAAAIRDGKPKVPPLSLAYWGAAHRQVRLVAKELEEMRAS